MEETIFISCESSKEEADLRIKHEYAKRIKEGLWYPRHKFDVAEYKGDFLVMEIVDYTLPKGFEV
jgi:hypothetical protein